jgi:cell division protein FtsW (lipid II flippase)
VILDLSHSVELAQKTWKVTEAIGNPIIPVWTEEDAEWATAIFILLCLAAFLCLFGLAVIRLLAWGRRMQERLDRHVASLPEGCMKKRIKWILIGLGAVIFFGYLYDREQADTFLFLCGVTIGLMAIPVRGLRKP